MMITGTKFKYATKSIPCLLSLAQFLQADWSSDVNSAEPNSVGALTLIRSLGSAEDVLRSLRALVSSASVRFESGPLWVLSRDRRMPPREVLLEVALMPAGKTAGLNERAWASCNSRNRSLASPSNFLKRAAAALSRKSIFEGSEGESSFFWDPEG